VERCADREKLIRATYSPKMLSLPFFTRKLHPLRSGHQAYIEVVALVPFTDLIIFGGVARSLKAHREEEFIIFYQVHLPLSLISLVLIRSNRE
jgi:hypothetical protein